MKKVSENYMNLRNNNIVKGKKRDERDKKVPILW